MVDYMYTSYIFGRFYNYRAYLSLFLGNLNECLREPLEHIVSMMMSNSHVHRDEALPEAFQPLHLYSTLHAIACERTLDVDNLPTNINIQQLVSASGLTLDDFGYAIRQVLSNPETDLPPATDANEAAGPDVEDAANDAVPDMFLNIRDDDLESEEQFTTRINVLEAAAQQCFFCTSSEQCVGENCPKFSALGRLGFCTQSNLYQSAW
jgi:hypothetical protein